MVERSYKKEKKESTSLAENIAPKRYWEIDFLRGLCVLLMIVDHFFIHANSTLPNAVWAFAKVEFWQGLVEFSSFYMVHYLRPIIRYCVIALFLIICGISCTLSHNNFMRACKTLLVSFIITMFTYLIREFFGLDVFIIFGVIYMLGCSMLLFSLFDFLGGLIRRIVLRSCKRFSVADNVSLWVKRMLPAAIGLIGLILYFTIPLGAFEIITKSINVDGQSVNFYIFELVSKIIIKQDHKWRLLLSMFVEFENYKPNSADYFPLMPYSFLVLIGSGIGQLVYHTKAKNALRRLDGAWNKPINFVGRHALLFYLIHAIVIVAFFYIVGGIYYIAK